MDVRVDAAGGDDHALAGDDLGARADHDVHARLDVGIARLAELRDPAALDGEVALDDPPPVDHQRVGDHRVGAVFRDALALPHAVADHLAAAELDLFAVHGEVLFHLDHEIGVGQPDPIADGGSEHLRVSRATDLHRVGRPTMPPPLSPVRSFTSSLS